VIVIGGRGGRMEYGVYVPGKTSAYLLGSSTSNENVFNSSTVSSAGRYSTSFCRSQRLSSLPFRWYIKTSNTTCSNRLTLSLGAHLS